MSGLKIMYYRRAALWGICTVRISHVCVLCGTKIEKGARAYRPIGNMNFRMKRICVDCAKQAEDFQ